MDGNGRSIKDNSCFLFFFTSVMVDTGKTLEEILAWST